MGLKKLIFWGFIFVTCAPAWADPRPLIERAGKECNASYFEAIKPTPDEVDWLFEKAVSSIRESLGNVEGSEHEIKWWADRYAANFASRYEMESVRRTEQKKIHQSNIRRDQCWEFAEGLRPSANSLNQSLRTTAAAAELRLAPALIGRLIKKGASVDAKDGTGMIFPVLVYNIFTESSIGTGTRAIEKARNEKGWQLRLDRLRLLISYIQAPSTLNARDSEGTTALAYAVRYGHDDVINALLDAGADPRLASQGGRDKGGWFGKHPMSGKTLIDMYTGGNPEVIKRLTGTAIKFRRPDVQQSLNWEGIDALGARGANEPQPQQVAGGQTGHRTIPAALVSSYSGVVNSSIQPNQPFAATGKIDHNGQFEYTGANGVVIRGMLAASGAQITGKGVSRLPEGTNGKTFTYPDGTIETEIAVAANFDGEVLRGEFASKYESGTFSMCAETARNNPACSAPEAPSVVDVLKDVNNFLGVIGDLVRATR